MIIFTRSLKATVETKIFTVFGTCGARTKSALNLGEQRPAWETVDLAKTLTCQGTTSCWFLPAFWGMKLCGSDYSFKATCTLANEDKQTLRLRALHGSKIWLWRKSRRISDCAWRWEFYDSPKDQTIGGQNRLAGLPTQILWRPCQEIVLMWSGDTFTLKTIRLQIPDDKVFKIRKFLNNLLTNFKDAFIPGKSKLHSFYLFFYRDETQY